MKKKILLITTLLFITLTPVSLWAAPIISIPENKYKFGSVPEGTVLKHHFIVKNNGDEPLLINNIITG